VNTSRIGSKVSVRPSIQAIAAAWQAIWLFRITSALQIVGCRDFTLSKKFREWRAASVPRGVFSCGGRLARRASSERSMPPESPVYVGTPVNPGPQDILL
jgi:hypothetical protein